MNPLGIRRNPVRDPLVGVSLAIFLVGVYRIGTPPRVPAAADAETTAAESLPNVERVVEVLESWGRAGELGDLALGSLRAGGSVEGSVGFAATSRPRAVLSPAAPPVVSALAPAPDVRRTAFGQIVDDLVAMVQFRPEFAFWENVFRIQDGAVAYGEAGTGRLLAVVPDRGAWRAYPDAWADESVAALLDSARLSNNANQRRDQVTALLEPVAGRLVSNPTRGALVHRSYPVYGSFLAEWGEIFEHFGVPAEIGLAQALVESGWGPRVRSEARAIGFCQWLEPNWNRLKRLAHSVIEAYNQTTQAAYCAAYLRILATKYGSFIPALSEHHAGGANVGRAVINGGWLGGRDTREQYLLGAQFAREVRELAPGRFTEVIETYGPRSYLYSEMVFGNASLVARFRSEIPQEPIHAVRVSRAISLQDVARRTGLSREEIQRFNPALVQQVPANGTLYLPFPVDGLGEDVAFWRAEIPREYAEVLRDFIQLGGRPEQWDDPSFEPLLEEYRKRFAATGTEQGLVMAAVLGYAIQETFQGRRGTILAEYRSSDRIQVVFREAQAEREVRLATEDR